MKLNAKWLLPSLLALALAGAAQAFPPGGGCPPCRGDSCAPDCPPPCAAKGCPRERACPPPCAEKPAPRDCGERPCFAPPPRQNPELREAHHAAMKLARQARAAEGEERDRLVAELREQVLRETQLVDRLQEERLDAIEKAARERIDAMREELRKMRENQDSFVDGQVERLLKGPGCMPPPEGEFAPSCDGPRFPKHPPCGERRPHGPRFGKHHPHKGHRGAPGAEATPPEGQDVPAGAAPEDVPPPGEEPPVD